MHIFKGLGGNVGCAPSRGVRCVERCCSRAFLLIRNSENAHEHDADLDW